MRRSPPPVPIRAAGHALHVPTIHAQPIAADSPPPMPGTATADTVVPAVPSGGGADDQFCMHCGVQMVENVRRCPQCGAYPDATDQYCIFCGQVLSSEVRG